MRRMQYLIAVTFLIGSLIVMVGHVSTRVIDQVKQERQQTDELLIQIDRALGR